MGDDDGIRRRSGWVVEEYGRTAEVSRIKLRICQDIEAQGHKEEALTELARITGIAFWLGAAAIPRPQSKPCRSKILRATPREQDLLMALDMSQRKPFASGETGSAGNPWVSRIARPGGRAATQLRMRLRFLRG